MKKHRDADALAARIAEAANQPAAVVANRPRVSPSPVTPVETEQATSPKPTRKRKKARMQDGETVGISIRPHRTLLSQYVLKAADRTREAGRVISAQEIMLEVLERGA
jgi:hypothetical protein